MQILLSRLRKLRPLISWALVALVLTTAFFYLLNNMGDYVSVTTKNFVWLKMEAAEEQNFLEKIFKPQTGIDIFENGMDMEFGKDEEILSSQSLSWIDIQVYNRKGVARVWVENGEQTDPQLQINFVKGFLRAEKGDLDIGTRIGISVDAIAREDTITVFAETDDGQIYYRSFTGREIYELSNQ